MTFCPSCASECEGNCYDWCAQCCNTTCMVECARGTGLCAEDLDF